MVLPGIARGNDYTSFLTVSGARLVDNRLALVQSAQQVNGAALSSEVSFQLPITPPVTSLSRGPVVHTLLDSSAKFSTVRLHLLGVCQESPAEYGGQMMQSEPL